MTSYKQDKKRTRGQERVLRNTLAWCGRDFQPSDVAIERFFAHIDRGQILVAPGSATEDDYDAYYLRVGWVAHYGDPFSQLDGKNPPMFPPAAWIYDAWYGPADSGWMGWGTLLMDFIRDARQEPAGNRLCKLCTSREWRRGLPAYSVAYLLTAYFNKCLTLAEFRHALAGVGR